MKKILLVLIFLLCVNIVNASIVVMDADSGRILYSKNKEEKKLIASTTKIMTSIIALEHAPLDMKIRIGKEVRTVNGSMIYVKEGEIFTLNDLLHGLMLQSGNDAAMTIATNVLGYDKFIKEMNLKAVKLGMNDTIFENPHGLNDDSKNYSTAKDMAILMKYAIKNKDFLSITSAKNYKVDKYIWSNKNKLLKEYKYYQKNHILDESRIVYMSKKELLKLNPNINKEPEKASMGAIFRTGDRVMQIKNNYDINWERKLFGEKEIGRGVFNGEIGTILKVDEKEKQIEIKFDDEKIAKYEFSDLDQIEHSYAITIHKAQRKRI